MAKESLKAVAGKGKGFIDEFKEFIAKGNVMDLAVGVIIGGAFSKIVTSLTDNILMPIIGVLIGNLDFTSLAIKVNLYGRIVNIRYGMFIQNVVDFLITALCIFVMIKTINKFMKKKEEPKKEEPPAKREEVKLLEEIRDELKKHK
jgi:large conductance mechanosensitive channel